jgi:hypothetical protein
MKIKYIAAVLIGLAGLSLQQVKADNSTFFLTTSNIPGFVGPINMVQVSITTDGDNTATVSFTSQTATVGGTNYIFMIGNGSAFDLNTSAAATTGTYAFTQPAGGGFAAPSVVTPNVSGQVDGFGVLNNTNTMFNGFDHAVTSVSFILTKASGNWGLAADVLAANANGAFAAAHIFITQAPGALANGATFTGYAANGGSVNTPDGGTTVMLLGVALGALGMARRFLRS